MAEFLIVAGMAGLAISVAGLVMTSYPNPPELDPRNVHSYPPGTTALWDQDAALRREDPLLGFLLPDGTRIRS